MRKLLPFAILVFLLPIIPFTPGASAEFSWSTTLIEGGLGGYGTTPYSADTDIVRLDNGILAVGYEKLSSRSDKVATLGASSWSNQTLRSGTTDGFGSRDMIAVANSAWMLYDDLTSGTTRVRSATSDDTGLFWSESTIVSIEARNLVHFTNGTTYAAVKKQSGDPKYALFQTTDGNTWTQITNNYPGISYSLAKKNDSVLGTRVLGTTYKSSNDGESWPTTATISSSSITGPLAYVSGTTWISASFDLNPGTSLLFSKSTNDMVSFGTITLDSGYTDGSVVALETDGGSNFGILVSENGGTTERRLSLWYSTDAGATWTESIIASQSTTTTKYSGYYDTDRAGLLFADGVWHSVYMVQDCTSGCPLRAWHVDYSRTAAIGDSVTVPVFNLCAFDVDEFGNGIITKQTETGAAGRCEFIRTYTGSDLTQANPTGTCSDPDDLPCTFDTDCDIPHGVMIDVTGNVAFINCAASDTNDQKNLYIRSLTTENPDFGGCTFCSTQISLDEFSDGGGGPGGDDTREIHEISTFPLDESNTDTVGVFDARKLSWGWSAASGFIGLDLFANIKEQNDQFDTAERGFSTPNQASQICVWSNDGEDRIGAAHSSTNTKIWGFNYNEPGFSGEDFQVSMDNTPQTISYQSAGIACALEQVFLQKPDGSEYKMFPLDGGAPLFSKTSDDPQTDTAQVAMDPTATIAAYVDGEEAVIIHADDGEEQCRVTMPSGTLIRMELVRNGGTIYIATDDNIKRQKLGDACGDIEDLLPSEGIPTEPTTDETGTGGLFGGQAETVGSALGTGRFGGGLFMAALMILGVSVVGGASLAKMSNGSEAAIRAGLIIFAIGGFFLAWATGLLSTGAVFAIVIISVVIIGGVYIKSGA